ncbi:MAG: hypothetical protein R3F61_14275 [Myxococcota bacterium]
MLWVLILISACSTSIVCAPDTVEVNGTCLSVTDDESTAPDGDTEVTAVEAEAGAPETTSAASRLAHRKP